MSQERNAREFDRHAHTYREMHAQSIRASGEEPEYFARYKIEEVRRVMAAGPSDRPLQVLDFGCGIGGSVPHLRAAFPDDTIVGADVSAESLAMARERYSEAAEFALIESDRLPFDDGRFDIVFTACVFHHIEPDQRDAALREIRRVLRPGGEFFFFEHNPLNPLTVRAVRDCPFDENAVLLSSKEARRRIDEAGFSSPRTTYTVFFPNALAALRPLEKYLGAVPLGAQYYVRAEA